MERDVILREVGLRDGLQMVKSQFPTEAKKQWISAAVAAGMPEIEVCSFVPPHVVPQFSDHAEVVAHARSLADLTVSALVPNAKGAERGFQLGVDKLNFVLSASETHNQKNVRCSTEQSLERFDQVMEVKRSNPDYAKTSVGGGVSTALGCTMEGAIEPSRVMWLIEEYLNAVRTKSALPTPSDMPTRHRSRPCFRRRSAPSVTTRPSLPTSTIPAALASPTHLPRSTPAAGCSMPRWPVLVAAPLRRSPPAMW